MELLLYDRAVPALHVLRVFANEDDEWGNPLGVLLEAAAIPAERRQAIAGELGFSETVFVEDPQEGRIRIHTPRLELPFAGHPTVGTAWLLARNGTPVPALVTPAGEVPVRAERDAAHVAAPAEWSPRFSYLQLSDPGEVRAMSRPRPAEGNVYVWAWIDEVAGTIRARSFVPEAGIAEDEATGSAALALCASLGRPVVIHQGRGSVLTARPAADGRTEVGGRVVLDEVREAPGSLL